MKKFLNITTKGKKMFRKYKKQLIGLVAGVALCAFAPDIVNKVTSLVGVTFVTQPKEV